MYQRHLASDSTNRWLRFGSQSVTDITEREVLKRICGCRPDGLGMHIDPDHMLSDNNQYSRIDLFMVELRSSGTPRSHTAHA